MILIAIPGVGRKSVVAVILVMVSGALPIVAHVGEPTVTLTQKQMLARYLADLDAHRYYAAWLLEAPCGVSFTVSNGTGAPVGSAGYQGRGRWVPPRGALIRHPILASVHVKRIWRLHIGILERNHIRAYAVAGWFQFDYTAVPWANEKHKNGFHVARIAMWQCAGRWGGESPEWYIGSGGELNWS